jgi:hypothetical protein
MTVASTAEELSEPTSEISCQVAPTVAKLEAMGGTWIDGRMKAAGEAAAALLLPELRHEMQAAQKTRRAMIRAAWLMTIICLTALSGAGGIILASLR